ncbi:MAG: phosphoribosyl-AMP cyclohydrolase [Ignisphaera sp.]|jgi:phosphoribosyl-AMP cyclohydrolase|nr:phosphoribosyl-AMP cyclohydrolase [Ignisphaera sp.]MCC6056105.1 phosphoribosyl-AMP cyclohydrolase [Desulfurococcaceae archaeon]
MKLMPEEAENLVSKLRFRHVDETVIAVVQDYQTKEVLMAGFMNREALIKTLTTGYLHLWSTSRRKLWLKGETSGNFQLVVDVKVDCDADAVLVLVKPLGPICHTGNFSCFYKRLVEL